MPLGHRAQNDGVHRSHTFSSHYLTNLNDKVKAHMHKKHKLGSADISGYHYQRWQKLNDTIPPTITANTEAHNPIPRLLTRRSATPSDKIQRIL
eukprot:1158799-Pelagomonas_calceolata.AAC.3